MCKVQQAHLQVSQALLVELLKIHLTFVHPWTYVM
jgi:hypothetical protein